MGIPLFDLSARLGLLGASQVKAGLLDVNESFAMVDAMAQKVGLSIENMAKLSAANLQILSDAVVSKFPGAKLATVSYEADRAIQGMGRSMLFVASTGNLAGRGMAGFISNVARLTGPGSILLSALAIGGLAIDTFFNRTEKGAERAERAIDKEMDAFTRAITSGSLEQVAKAAVEQDTKIAKLEERLKKLNAEAQAARERGGLGGLAPGGAGLAGGDQDDAIKQINEDIEKTTFLLNEARDIERGILDDKERETEIREVEKRMAEERAQIEMRTSEMQEAMDAKHLKAAAIAAGAVHDAETSLANLRRAFNSLQPSAEQLRAMRDADAEMRRRQGESATTRAFNQENKDEGKKPEREKQDGKDELSHLEEQNALLAQGATQANTAGAALLRLSTIETELKRRLAESNLSLEERIRLEGDLDTATAAVENAQSKLRATFDAQPEQQILIKAQADQKARLAAFTQDARDFGTQLGAIFTSTWSHAFNKGALKNGLEDLGKTGLTGLGNMMVQQSGVLKAFGTIMSSLAPALANPFTAGEASIGASLALFALGSAFASIGNAMSSSGANAQGSPLSAYYGPASTVTTLYGGPGGNPVTGLPEPTGPQQPIHITVGPVIGPNDQAAFQSIIDGINNAARGGYALKTFAVKGA